ncbi:MAG: HAMP domain-containing histidine kinase, partial [Desulfobulbaceae bacterium]|nr:HAMP domain-containing histidine kinase [Candidatus Desulfobia pelagia]
SHAIIVETHHGKINVKTQPGKGTTFIIELPQNRSSYENGEPEAS